MKATELVGDVDKQHRLHAQLPAESPAGQVRPIVLPSEEDAGGSLWERGIANEWSADLSDAQQDIYTIEDGQPAVHINLA